MSYLEDELSICHAPDRAPLNRAWLSQELCRYGGSCLILMRPDLGFACVVVSVSMPQVTSNYAPGIGCVLFCKKAAKV